MRRLNKQEITDILVGCTVLGTGGGGNLATGLDYLRKDLEAGRTLDLMPLSELPDDALVATPYGCGAPAAEGDEVDPQFADLPRLDDSAAVLAFQKLSDYMGKPFTAVSTTELGGENTAEALHIACVLGLPVLDADPAGRSVPELQHSTYYVKGEPIYPLSVATNFGESVIIENVPNDLRAEAIVRAIAVASGNEVGVTDHPMTGRVFKRSVIPDAISYAENIGRILRECGYEPGAGAKSCPAASTEPDAGPKPCPDAAAKIAAACSGKAAFRGTLIEAPWELRDGFNYGTIRLAGIGEYEGSELRITFQNETMAAWQDDHLIATVPDLICLLDDGRPFTIPNFRDGMIMDVVLLPAADIWRSPEGVAVFGPRTQGVDVDYIPFEKLL